MFYAYKGKMELGKEPCGMVDHGSGKPSKMIIRDLKTERGAKNRCIGIWGDLDFRLFRFTNIYDNSTFREVRV